MDLIWLFGSFNGRIGRWTYTLAQFALGLLIAGCKFILPGLSPGLQVLAVLALAVPTVALIVKRLHDIGQSAVLAVIPVACVAWLMWLASRRSGHLAYRLEIRPPFEARDMVLIAVTLVGAGFTWWLAAAPGQRFANAFGDPPS